MPLKCVILTDTTQILQMILKHITVTPDVLVILETIGSVRQRMEALAQYWAAMDIQSSDIRIVLKNKWIG